MSNRPMRTPHGSILQAGIPKRSVDANADRPMGLIMRAVVTATYVVDDESHPYTDLAGEGVDNQAVYCDVICYSNRAGMRTIPLQAVLVAQPWGGMHTGLIWKPRATGSLDVTGNPVDVRKGTRLTDMGGDHVLVAFLDNDFKSPVIIGSAPHPRADEGNAESGKQLRLKLADGDPNFIKHHGVVFGVATNGDFLVDTRLAYDGTVDSNGKEPAAPTDGPGAVRYRLPEGGIFQIEVNGDSSAHPALAEHLETLYGSLKSYIEGATVPTGMGPSGTVQAGSGPAPSWDASINSTKVEIPDED